ncbi:MAG: imidazolonepropionase [Prevotella sp.]|jgi:imidazolonepropionase|nr:imidazolonepropionase [Prevotella sp.]
MQTLIKNIGLLAGIQETPKTLLRGAEMAEYHTMANAWLVLDNGRISDYGPMPDYPIPAEMQMVIDAGGGAVFPSFCDSHTHLVYAGSREGEFVDKIRGLSYAEIAKRGGGILNSADRLHNASEEELYEQAMRRIREILLKGTGAVEIKSGYGLNTADELKMLRVIRRIKQTTPIKVIPTFLGAHAVGREYIGRQSEYVDMIVNEMIPAVGEEKLAFYIDVFCDKGFFTPEETIRILEAGAKYGLRGKIHGQELADSGGVEAAVKCNALSVDHLESMTDRDIELLKAPQAPIPTALPGTSFFLNMPFAPARKMIDAGLPLALASDYNPGSTPSGDMKFIVSLACMKMGLLPAEALNAATINSAAAMGLSDEYGCIRRGCIANIFITEPIPSIDYIPYAYTSPTVKRVFLQGIEYR